MNQEQQSGFVYGLVGILAATVVFVGGYQLRAPQESVSAEVPQVKDQGVVRESSDAPEGVVLYYGEECPHCHDAIEHLETNGFMKEGGFETKETWHDDENAAELVERARFCGYEPNRIGVPFLYADGECHIGTPDIIRYFDDRFWVSGAGSDGKEEEE